MAFNKAQETAVHHNQGPALVLAGPGSGKTTVITHRVKNLIEQWGVNPSGILVITFTKAAAGEMKERFHDLMEGKAVRVAFGTFHAIFFQILKLAYGFDASNIVREEQRNQAVRQMVDQLGMELEDEGDFVASILTEISAVKGEMISLDHYYAKNCSEEIFKKLYTGYEAYLRKENRIDFDDMLVMCYELFTKRPDILGAWQKKYRYILVDEFQDINRVQYEIVRMLAKPENNLFIVGDDDQSIYRFRGAKPEIMLGFERDYPEARKILLNVNYRSTKEIIGAATRLIGNNEVRYPKEIIAASGSGRDVVTRGFADASGETDRIVDEIKWYHEAGYGWNDMAVLYRTNSGPRLLIEKLMEYNIPFKTRDAVPNLYEHWIARDVLAYMKMAGGNRERSLVLSVINRPKRYVSRDALDGPVVSFESVKSFYQDKDWMVERIEQLEYDLKAMGKMAPAAALNYLQKAVGYDEFLREYAVFRRIKPEELFEILDQLKESSAGFKTFDDWSAHIQKYTEELKNQALINSAKAEGVSLSTMHSSKGLEYKIVYILDANEGVTPHCKAVLDADMEEERRLFYVAMTRAKERLHVYYLKERYHKKVDVSRFVEEYLNRE